jgi:hypothetical protein
LLCSVRLLSASIPLVSLKGLRCAWLISPLFLD